MTKDKQQLLELIERLDDEIDRQRHCRGDFMDYGTPDPLLVEARAALQSLLVENERLKDAAYHCEQARTYISQPAAITPEKHMVSARYHLDQARTLLGDS